MMLNWNGKNAKLLSWGDQTIQRAYLGDKLVFSNKPAQKELVYFGAITPLSIARGGLAATVVGSYALFGGGQLSSGLSSVVDAYDTSLTRTTPAALSTARQNLAAATVGDVALFAGGGTYPVSKVDSYDTNLITATPTPLSNARANLAAVSFGNYALFGGGMYRSTTNKWTYYSTVDVYDVSLTRTNATALQSQKQNLAATSTTEYALFAGGNTSSNVGLGSVNAYDASLTRLTPPALGVGLTSLAGASVGEYVLFGGGLSASSSGTKTFYAVVYAYDSSLVRTQIDSLSKNRSSLSTTTLGDYAVFAGGNYLTAGETAVDAYDASLVHSIPPKLTASRMALGGVTINSYALFGGGASQGTGRSNKVDVYTVQ